MTFRKRASVALLLLGLLVRPARAALPFGPVGTEFPVNTYTTYYQGFGGLAVTADAAGNFVVVWDSEYDQDGNGDGVFGQRFDSTGTPVGPEFQVNTYTTWNQGSGGLSAAADAAGNFVVVWNSGLQDGSDYGVFGQRFDNLGNPVGAEFQVNTYTTGAQGRPGPGVEVASDPTGNFVVVWSGQGPGDTEGVFARRYDNLGNALGSEFLVNTYTTGNQGYQGGPAIAVNAGGNFIVVWDSDGQDGDDEGVFGQRFDAAGTPVGPEFQVNTYTTNHQGDMSLAVAAAPGGNFMVAWSSYKQVGDNWQVFGQRFASTGSQLGGEFQVNTNTLGMQGTGGYIGNHRGVGVAADTAGNFLVVWDRDSYDFLTGWEVIGQRYDGAGNPLGGEFQVNTYTTSVQFMPAIGADGAGHFIVAWASNCDGCEDESQDGSYSGVFGQRFGDINAGLIAGRRMSVRNPTGGEFKRTVVVSGKETASDIAAIDGNPVANGATLRIIASGTTDSDQTFVLDNAGWTATRSGFRYKGPTGADGDPVRRVSFKRGRTGTVTLKATLKGRYGTQDLSIVPPSTGDSGGAILTINGGGTYCMPFGGSAGGLEFRDTAQNWLIAYTTAQPGCPEP